MFKPNDDIVYENIVACNASFNSDLVGSVHQSDEVFQVVKESSFKEKETSHEISLQQEISLCDVSMQGLKKLKSVETPMQCKSLLNNGLINHPLRHVVHRWLWCQRVLVSISRKRTTEVYFVKAKL